MTIDPETWPNPIAVGLIIGFIVGACISLWRVTR